ncbi:MAG TPA: MFS transporter [Candidatus Woesebacteria bacterium]|nr:MFS transporter [Candidatus Woesebacteria bacterium]
MIYRENRNIKLIYCSSIFRSAWFWLGIWIYYYLRFTNYAGIGMLETVLMIASVFSAIPSGAITDLVGKRTAIICALILEVIGLVMMGLAPNLFVLTLSIIILNVADPLYGSSRTALAFDSLLEKGQESHFKQAISNINTIQLFIPALAGALGGFLYSLSPQLPFLAAAGFDFIALTVSFFLKEPAIDSDQFSVGRFLHQTKSGFRQLAKTNEVFMVTIVIVIISLATVISYQSLDSYLAVEMGFSQKQIGLLWSIIFLIAAAASQLTSYFLKKLSVTRAIALTGVVICTSLILSPWSGMLFEVLLLTLRASLTAIFNNLSSVAINQQTPSRYRATTLSTLEMLKNLPYLLTAFVVGAATDRYSAKSVALVLGTLVLMGILVWQQVKNRQEKAPTA